ncbi:hypothetical protein [Streptomyces sp. 3N207]|uniref:hypothetical protein n=1 Tax=Streptomyces sp. 3N207 TaxID=3457417 RepID=UPI003FCF480D
MLRRKRDLRRAAYRAQCLIVLNPGHAAWRDAWSGKDRYAQTGEDALRVIAGPLLSRADQIDEAMHDLLLLKPPQPLAETLTQARDALQPLLELRPAWIELLKSRTPDALAMDLDFGGYRLDGWVHEDEAISRVLALAPVLDRAHSALVPWSGMDLAASATH